MVVLCSALYKAYCTWSTLLWSVLYAWCWSSRLVNIVHIASVCVLCVLTGDLMKPKQFLSIFRLSARQVCSKSWFSFDTPQNLWFASHAGSLGVLYPSYCILLMKATNCKVVDWPRSVDNCTNTVWSSYLLESIGSPNGHQKLCSRVVPYRTQVRCSYCLVLHPPKPKG